jgi:competence protein ComEC
MDERIIKVRMAVLATLLVSAVLVWWPEITKERIGSAACDPTLLCVVFLDVGQGDATFIQSPSGAQILIDSGRDQSVLRELSSMMGFFDRDLDYVVITHPDADHISGFPELFERLEVMNVIRTENESDTSMWRAVEQAILDEGSQVYFARRGQRYDLGGGVVLEILFPDMDPTAMESNTSSIIAKLTHGKTAFMLTGDAPKSIEEYLVLVEGEHLESDVLKVGHHGSRTSTSELFLDEVAPQYGVISAGKDNSYGHPHVEVTDALFNAGVATLNTAEHGRVIFWSDGQTVQLRQ